LSGTAISREARLVTICDAYITLRETRPRRQGLTHDEAMGIIVCGDDKIRPSFFDPSLLGVFLVHGEQFRTWWDTVSAAANGN
jgi:HD-GYP domain-containing protein (c-di-GMP phosphodiesterase class II)